jgi:O-antigen/teichoic acid export membrane protein
MVLYSRERTRRALFYTIAFRALSQLSTVLSFVVLVRGLTEQSLGIYSLLYSIIPVMGTVVSLGLDQVLRRYQPEYLQAGNLAGAAWMVRTVTRLRLLTNLVLLAAIILGWNLFAPLIHLADQRSNFELFTIIVLLYFQTMLLQSSLASHMLQGYSVGSIAVLSIAKLISYLIVYNFFAFTLRAAIVADVVSFGLTYVFLRVAHWKLCSPKPADAEYQPQPDEWRRLRRYAIANNFNESSSVLLHVQTDNFFIAAMMTPVAVGAYAFYVRLNEMAGNLIPTRLFDNILQPLFFSVGRDQAAERLPRYVTFMINISLMVQWPLFAYSLVYHREIILAVFHGKFIEQSLLLPLIVGFALTNNVISTPITMTALYGEQASLILKSQLFGLYQIAAMLTLIPLIGLYGAAIATGTLHLFRNLWVWWHVRKTARWTNAGAALRAGCLIWGGAMALCWCVKMQLHAPDIVQLCLGALICAIALLLYVRSAAVSTSDRGILSGVLHGRESAILGWLGLSSSGSTVS